MGENKGDGSVLPGWKKPLGCYRAEVWVHKRCPPVVQLAARGDRARGCPSPKPLWRAGEVPVSSPPKAALSAICLKRLKVFLNNWENEPERPLLVLPQGLAGEASEARPWAVNKALSGRAAARRLSRYFRGITASFEFYLHDINLIVSLECAIPVVIT